MNLKDILIEYSQCESNQCRESLRNIRSVAVFVYREMYDAYPSSCKKYLPKPIGVCIKKVL